MPTSATSLAVPPRQLAFLAHRETDAERRLAEVLRQHDRTTDTLPISRVSDAVLNQAGLVQDRFRFTTTALSQLCSLLVSGFARTVAILAGMRNEEETPEGTQIAISLINQLLSARFAKIEGLQLVVNRTSGHIEGLAGRRYSFYSNWELYQQARTFARNRAVFSEGLLSGRRMVLRYRANEPLLELQAGERFYGGYQFENAEIMNCALRLGSLLIRGWCGSKAIPPLSAANWVRHVSGPSFERRLAEILSRLPATVSPAATLRSQLVALTTTNLQLGGDKPSHERRRQELQVRLARAKALDSPGLARRVLDRMLTFGSYRADALPRGQSALVGYARRTAYDLFTGLIRQAQDESLRDRLLCERLAYTLLSGRFRL